MDVSTTISLAEISQYLWCDTIPKENVFFNGTIDPRKARQLYLIRKSLQYGVAENLSNQLGLCNYLYALCGAKLQNANAILGTGTSGGSVIIGGGGDYGVYEYSANAVKNAVSIIFTIAIGKRLIYSSRGGIDAGSILTTGSPTGNQITWEKSSGTLTVASSVPFDTNEFIRILVQQ